MLKDILYALRTFRQNPGFTAVIVVSIALGIAANTTVFSLVNGLLLGALPVQEQDRLVTFSAGRTFSQPDYLDYREQTRDVFEGISAHFPLVPASLGATGTPERIWGQIVSGNYFQVIRPGLALGRGILPGEDKAPGRDAVVVLSHGLWQRRFAGDRGVLGRSVRLNGRQYTVVGVAAPEFIGTERGIVPEFWAPLSMMAEIMPDLAKNGIAKKRGAQWLMLNARLKPGVTRKQALAAVRVVKQRIEDTYFPKDDGRRRRIVSLDKAGGLIDGSSGSVFSLMAVLMVVVGLVLMIACANVANLLLARAASRQKEVAVRLSMGATRFRLIRQLLTESVLLSMFGAFGGFVLATWAANAISSFQLPLPIPISFDFAPDARVLAFTAALSILTGLIFGLAPALKATRLDVANELKNGAAVVGRSRRFGMRNALVVVQVALSLVLLTGSGLFLRSLQHASSIDIGMRADNVLVMAFDPKLLHYSPEKTRQLLRRLRERVSALPEVQSVSYIDSLPLSLGGTTFDFTVAEAGRGTKSTGADVYNVGERFFETMALPLRRGRDFRGGADSRDVAVINENMSKKLFGDADPIGRQITAEKVKYTVIGVAGNTKSRTLGEDPAACAYLFLEPRPEDVVSFFGISIAVKTHGNPRKLQRAVSAEIAALDPDLPTFNTETMKEHLDKALLLPRICATLLSVFGCVGLTLATIGLYGVMSYTVRRRTREFGIRVAIGARSSELLIMVLRQGLALAGAGLAIGLAMALALSQFAASLLYGINVRDLVTFTVVPLVLLAVTMIAIIIPARRAAKVQPMSALRYE